MKTRLIIIFSFYISLSVGQVDMKEYSKPYFSLGVPTLKAEDFMDGVVLLIDEPEMCGQFVFSGQEFYYNKIYNGKWSIFFTQLIHGGWTNPKPIGFTKDYIDRDFTFSPDGNILYFGSNRPIKSGSKTRMDLNEFYSERITGNSWGEPLSIGENVNSINTENYPSVDKGKNNDWDSYISPDGSYLIFSSQDRSDSFGRQDLYISFNDKNGNWIKAVNMGSKVNSLYDEICPYVTSEGRILFFTSRRRGLADIF